MDITWKEMQIILSSLFGKDNIIPIPVALVELTGDYKSAAMLNQIIYWCPKTNNPTKYVYKSYEDWSKELSLPISSIRLAKNKLERLELIKTKKEMAYGVPTIHYKPCFSTLFKRLGERTGKVYPKHEIKEVVAGIRGAKTAGVLKQQGCENEQMEGCDSTQMGGAVPRKSITGKNKNIKKEETDNKFSSDFFDLWNKQGIITHKNMSTRTPMLIQKVLDQISPEQFRDSIINYKNHLDSIHSHWSYKWKFDDFMSRGLSKEGLTKGGGFWHFVDNPVDVNITPSDQWEFLRKEFQPLTSIYSKVFDESTQKYYGFSKTHINSKIRFDDVYLMIKDKDTIDFSKFRELEFMIAGMLYRRKQRPEDVDLCEKYVRVWKQVYKEFKGPARKFLKEEYY